MADGSAQGRARLPYAIIALPEPLLQFYDNRDETHDDDDEFDPDTNLENRHFLQDV